MIKAVVLLKRKDGMSHGDFARWLREKHPPLVLKLPGLRRYQVNIAQDGDGEYDGFSELWFDSEDALRAAYDTEGGKAVTADSLAHVKTRKRIVVTEHSVAPAD